MGRGRGGGEDHSHLIKPARPISAAALERPEKKQPQRSNLCDSIVSSRHSSKRESVETLTAKGSSLDTQRRQPVMGIVQSHGDIVLHGDYALKRLST